MAGKRKNTATASEWRDPDDAPELDDAFFERAEIREGERIVLRGRLFAKSPKQAVRLRLDADVVAHFKESGSGWQTRINATLRRAMARARKPS